MVRLLIPLVAIFLIWLLFFSSLSKRLRIGLSAAVVLATIFGLWLDTNGRGINTKRITPAEVTSCGISGEYSYRTNYNLTVCLQNNSGSATVQRLRVRYDMLECATGDCQIIDSSEAILNVAIPANDKIQHVDNVSFKRSPGIDAPTIFAADVLEVWASR